MLEDRYGVAQGRPLWRVVLGVLLVVGGAGLFIVLELSREDHTAVTFTGLFCGLVVALGVVALQRPKA